MIETWGWISLLSAGDPRHADTHAAVERLLDANTPLVTAWVVVSELMSVASGSRGRTEWGKNASGHVAKAIEPWLRDRQLLHEVVNTTDAQFREALDLRLRHIDVPNVSLVDSVVAITCRDTGISEIVSGDGHLRILLPGVRLLPDDLPA